MSTRPRLAANYPQGFLDAGKVDGELYALPAKYNNKGTMWYRPDLFKAANVAVPKTWDEFKTALAALKGKPGAMSLGAKDDWTLTDWFESIYIRQAGVAAYDKLFSAEGDWADPTVQKAVDTMLEVINDDIVVGGIDAAVGRAWTDAHRAGLRADPRGGRLLRGRLRRRHRHRPDQQGPEDRRRRSTGPLPVARQHRRNPVTIRWRRHRGAHRPMRASRRSSSS